ncbi:MAG: SUMF1/EgtB/PvdO family nonheme iron enzyme [Bacteroidota bacterium]
MTRSAGNNWLLTIALDEYQDENIPNLFNPVQDAQQIENVLKNQYGFAGERIIRCFDKEATRSSILKNLNKVRKKAEENDSVIIYHAGHGILNDRKTRGFWISYDANQDDIYSCVRYSAIIESIEDFSCRHVLLISDSCYAGSMIKTRDVLFGADQDLGEIFKTPSRWIITSGRNKPVADGVSGEGSPFALSLIDQLKKNTDTLRVSTLADKVLELTENKTNKKQTPNFGQLVINGNEGGQFIFRKKTPHKKSLDPLQQDVSAWNEAKRAYSQQAYESYLKDFPEGEFVELAQSRIAQLSAYSLKDKDIAAWKAAKEQDSLEGYQGYLREFPEGEFVLLAERAQERKRKASNRRKEKQHRKEKVQAYVEEGESLFQEEDYEGAIECWEEALEIAKGTEKKEIEKKLTEAKEKQKPKSHPLLQEIGIEMITIEGGSFMMGSEDYDDEKPIHEVSLSTFQLAKTPITQQQWENVMGKNPYSFKGCSDCPVEYISWDDAHEFLQKLHQQTGQSFHLPTEAQWEFAARGGNLSKGYTYAGSNDSNEVAWYSKNAGNKTHPVGQKKPNELGLYDMSGNVWEWCQDWYDSYPSGSQTDPTGPTSGAGRVRRGGSWYSSASVLRVAYRHRDDPSDRNVNLGFRPARTP